MNAIELADAFFRDCEIDNRVANEENLRAWLWFTCPAAMRRDAEKAIRADARSSPGPHEAAGKESEDPK